MKLWDYHIHLENGPFTLDWLNKFIDTAKKRGLVEIGISEHGYRFKETLGLLDSRGFRDGWVKKHSTQTIDHYIELIKEAKNKKLPVKLGIEMDYTPEREKEIKNFLEEYEWDYVIGSVHWIDDWGFDLPEQKEEWDRRDTYEAYLEYYDRLNKAVLSGIFDIIGHIDVIKVFGYRPDKDVMDAVSRTLDNIKKKGLSLEVSTAGLRKPVGEMYPSEEILKLAVKKGISLVINSDAHHPEDVGRDFDFAVKYVKRCGGKEVVRFSNRGKKVYKLEEVI